MTVSRNALLLFCKPPLPGWVKTRLYKENGGPLEPEQAAEFFRRSLLDVTELGMLGLSELEELNAQEREDDPDAPERRYDYIISTTPQSSVDVVRKVFEDEGGWSHPITYLCDTGSSFDEHFDDAFNQLFDAGYDNVVAIGGDLPTLPLEHIVDAFLWLDRLSADDPHGYALVMAPCQQSGVSLVGYTRATPIDSQGVYYNLSGLPVLDGYVRKLQREKVPSAYLTPVADVDRDGDLAHLVSCLNAIAEASEHQTGIYLARRVLEWIDATGLYVDSPPNDEHDPRQYLDS